MWAPVLSSDLYRGNSVGVTAFGKSERLQAVFKSQWPNISPELLPQQALWKPVGPRSLPYVSPY